MTEKQQLDRFLRQLRRLSKGVRRQGSVAERHPLRTPVTVGDIRGGEHCPLSFVASRLFPDVPDIRPCSVVASAHKLGLRQSLGWKIADAADQSYHSTNIALTRRLYRACGKAV